MNPVAANSCSAELIEHGVIVPLAMPAPELPALPASEPVLRARGLTRSFGRVTAVADVDLALRAGHVMALVDAFFFDPGPDALIAVLPNCIAPGEAPHDPALVFADYLRSKLDHTYGFRSSQPITHEAGLEPS
jgi:hypothetical protein